MPDRIKQLSKKYMENQIIIEVKKKQEINKLIEQSFCRAKQSEKFEALSKIIDVEDFFYGIIFCRTKMDVDKVTSLLKKSGHEVDCIHGDIPQVKREKILNRFKTLKLNILVATDVAARGIDVENLSHVINYSLPEDVETYTHRIGRTGRAGNKGKAISLVSPSEMRRISQIESSLKNTIAPLKLPSQKEIREHNSKKILVEIDGIVESIDTSLHLAIADQLLAKHDPAKVISALLHKIDSKSEKNNNLRFDEEDERSKTKTWEKDRNIANDFNSNRGNRNRNVASKGNERVFIAKGKMDKMDKNSLIGFIQRETGIKLGKVKDVKVCDKFSFLTLNSKEANEVVSAFESKARGRRPVAEIAQR
ncbi:MAG: DEAD/DEAH box helicase [Nanoarchaeota archaeon]|nr:DEAD/DEAH box helicase [Nanoarchaeota archaeon]